MADASKDDVLLDDGMGEEGSQGGGDSKEASCAPYIIVLSQSGNGKTTQPLLFQQQLYLQLPIPSEMLLKVMALLKGLAEESSSKNLYYKSLSCLTSQRQQYIQQRSKQTSNAGSISSAYSTNTQTQPHRVSQGSLHQGPLSAKLNQLLLQTEEEAGSSGPKGS